MANFGDRYELTERIGSGSTGEVWLALDERLGGRPVAVKIVHRQLRPASGDAGRFEHELRLAAQLDHPNIVDIYATGTYRDAPFLVMEYLERQDLGTVLPGGEPGQVAAIGRDICAALAHAHGRGMIHGDLKPGNAVLRGARPVKVTDFGMARAVSAAAPSSSPASDGMLAYLSPEQWRGAAPASGDDVWAAGCLLYRLVSGRLPRVLPGAAEYTAAALRGDPVPDLRQVSAAPDWLAGTVMAMLDPDPARRVTAGECARLLSGPPPPATVPVRPPAGWLLPEQYGSGDSGPDRGPGTAAAAGTLTARGGRSHGRVISAVAVALLLVAAGSVAAWRLSSSSRTTPPTLSRAVTTSPAPPAGGQAPVPSTRAARPGSAAAASPSGTSASPARSHPASPPGSRPAPPSGSRPAFPPPSGAFPPRRPASPPASPPRPPGPLPSGTPSTTGSVPPPGGPPPSGAPPPPPGAPPPPPGAPPPPPGAPPPPGGPPGGGPPPGGPPPNAADTAA